MEMDRGPAGKVFPLLLYQLEDSLDLPRQMPDFQEMNIPLMKPRNWHCHIAEGWVG
jgi:hypothetical protein